MAHEVKTNAMRYLDRNRVPYTVRYYDCEQFIDGITVAKALGVMPERTFKTLVTQGKSGGHFVFLIPVEKELHLKKAARLAREKALEMVHVKDIQPITGYIRGACTPVGMKKAFPTFFDECCLAYDTIYVSGGAIGTQMEVSPRELIRVSKAETADLIQEK